jgi:hypothetical protein
MVILLCQAFFTFHSSVSTVDIGLTATEMRMACNFLPDIHTKWTPEGALSHETGSPSVHSHRISMQVYVVLSTYNQFMLDCMSLLLHQLRA